MAKRQRRSLGSAHAQGGRDQSGNNMGNRMGSGHAGSQTQSQTMSSKVTSGQHTQDNQQKKS